MSSTAAVDFGSMTTEELFQEYARTHSREIKWEIALRNSTLFPDSEVQPLAGYRNWNQTTLGITRYIIGHSLKVQADMSYNTRSRSIDPDYNRWEIRFQLELGL